MAANCDCLRAGETERGLTWVHHDLLGKICFLSWLVYLGVSRCLEVWEQPNEQVLGTIMSSSAVFPQTVQPWTRSSQVVAFTSQVCWSFLVCCQVRNFYSCVFCLFYVQRLAIFEFFFLPLSSLICTCMVLQTES